MVINSKSDGKKLKKIKKLKSLNTVMLLYFCLLAFLLIMLVEIVFSIAIYSVFESHARNKVEQASSEMTVALKNFKDEGNLNNAFVKCIEEGVTVYLFSKDGEVLMPSQDTFALDDAEEKFDEILSKIGSSTSVTYRTRSAVCTVSYLRAERYGESYLMAIYSLNSAHSTVSTMQLYLIIIGCIVLLLALSISYSFTQKLTRGMKSLSDNAVILSRGDFSAQFTNADYKELAQLSDTLNNLRDEVKKSGDFQREILANVTHDLKTPITMIKAYALMIREISGDDPVKRDKHLQVIIDESDRLTGLINDVLSVSKVNSNLMELNPKVFNLTEFLYGIINKFGYLQETQGYNFMVDIDPNLYTRADEEKIGQVIYNLLGNAANYTGEDKTVYISLKKSMDGERIKFSVRDTGKGIEKEEIPNIWDRYYRSKKDHVRPVKGTGLGLNIVKVILTNHSFDFGVESELGNGSTFWVDFPSVPSDI